MACSPFVRSGLLLLLLQEDAELLRALAGDQNSNSEGLGSSDEDERCGAARCLGFRGST